CKLSALLMAHVADGYQVASDILTPTSEFDDIAPDASIFPNERAEGGGRKLEELAFEVASTQSLARVGRKAHKFCQRGVRRVFVVDVARQRALEWSAERMSFQLLEPDALIEDRTLAVALPVKALVKSAKVDDAVAH